MRTKIAVAALLTITAGMFTFTRTKNAPPSDLRDAMASPGFTSETMDMEEAKRAIVPMPATPVNTYTYDNLTPGASSAASKFFSVPDQLEKIYIINLNTDKLMLAIQYGQSENLVLVRTADTPERVVLVINGNIQIELDFSKAERFRYARKAFAYYLFHEKDGKYKLAPFTGASSEKITSSLTNSYSFKVTEWR